jgi:hypothetical protein
VLLLIGIVLMTANAAKNKASDTGGTHKGANGEKVVYKLMTPQMDEFYQHESVAKPSKVYYSVFNEEDVVR